MELIILLFYISLFFISVIILFAIRIIISKYLKKRIPIIVLLVIAVAITLIIPVSNLSIIVKIKINETVINRKYNENDYLKYNENELINEFKMNKSKIDNDLKNRVILLTGKIQFKITPKSYKPIQDVSYLHFGDFGTNQIFIKCLFNDTTADVLKKDDIVTIIGKYRGYNVLDFDTGEKIEIIIGDCIMINN
jgi:hypothetical protein